MFMVCCRLYIVSKPIIMFGQLYFSDGHPNTPLRHSTWQSIADQSMRKPWSIFDDMLQKYKVRNRNKESCIHFSNN